MKRITRYLLAIMLALVLSGSMPIVVMAATTSTVTVTFTPQTIALGATTPNSWAAGFIADSGTAETATGYFSTANTSNVVTDITIGVTQETWTGGTAYAHDDDGDATPEPGADKVALMASPNTGAFDIAVPYTTPLELKDSLAATTACVWEAKLYAQTSHSDSVEKTNTIVLIATLHT
jgi:hypothetical protein